MPRRLAFLIIVRGRGQREILKNPRPAGSWRPLKSCIHFLKKVCFSANVQDRPFPLILWDDLQSFGYEIKWKRIFSETTKRALEHYGHDLDELETRDPQIGTWPIEKAMERLKSLPDFMDFVDDTKKVRITFEYDPDYPTALLLVEASMKPVQWVPYTSEGETREADHSDV